MFTSTICWLQSNLKPLKSSKLPIYDTFASLVCLVHVFCDIKRLCAYKFVFQARGCLHSQLQTLFRLATVPHYMYVNSSP